MAPCHNVLACRAGCPTRTRFGNIMGSSCYRSLHREVSSPTGSASTSWSLRSSRLRISYSLPFLRAHSRYPIRLTGIRTLDLLDDGDLFVREIVKLVDETVYLAVGGVYPVLGSGPLALDLCLSKLLA